MDHPTTSNQQLNRALENSELQNDDCILPVDLEKISSNSLDSLKDYLNLPGKIKVFLRIRPLATNLDSIFEDQDEVFTILNPTNLLTKIPITDGSSTSRPSKHPNNVDSHNLRKYKFTSILTPEISQTQLFDEVAKQNVLEFIEGQSSTLMSYGTSNAGKTYSLFGTNDSLGIIPCSIKFLFSNIECTVSPFYKPGNGNTVINFNELDRTLNSEAIEKLFICRKFNKSQNLDTFLKLGDFSLKEEAGFDGFFYSIWLSFVEIYNENIFDLLTIGEEGKNMQLKLVTDKKGNSYLKGVRKVFVTTSEEAFQIMMAGKSRLRMASTAMNSKSSRSHAIFNITLLKYSKNSAPEDVTVSTLTFCDLAGSGGLRKTNNSQRIKESRSINASLLVLGRCLKTIQENLISKNNTEVIGPFRESNLTRYLQKALSGKENLIILVNLNRSPELYVETQNVLNFVSIVNKMTPESLKNPKKSTFSRGISRSSTWVSSPNISSCNTPVKTPKMNENNYEKLKEENNTLLKELSILKNCALDKEYEIRQELCDLYSSKMKDLEKDWRKKTEELDEEREDLLKWSVKQVEDYYKERINNITNRKRKRLSNHEGHGDSEDSTIESLEAENAEATSKIIALKEVVANLKKKNVDLSVKKSELIFELSITKKELEDLKMVRRQNESITFEVEENSVNRRRESFLFEFTEYWARTNELEEQLENRNEQIEKLKAQLEDKDQEISDIKENLQKAEGRILENTLKNRAVEDKVSNMVSKSIVEPEDRIIVSNLQSNASSPNSMYKISFTDEENSLFINNETPRVSLRTLVTVPILESIDLQEDNRLSFLDSSIEKSEKSMPRLSQTSDEDDSGIRTSSGSRGTSDFNKENEDKSIQVDFNPEEDIEKIKSKLESLKLEYETLRDNYSNKSSKVEDLVREIEEFKTSISELEAHSVSSHKKLEEYEVLLASKDKDLERLNLDKKQLDIKYNVTCTIWKTKIKDYEKKLKELSSIKKNTEICVTDDLEKSIKKCVNLGNQITIDQAQLEQKVLKCSTQHVPKIKKLEQELVEKNLMVSNLNEKISEAKLGLSRFEQFDEKIKNFEIVLYRNVKEKEDLLKQLQERTSHQIDLEAQLTSLSEKITKRDSDLLLLKENFNHARSTNAINYKNNNELSNLISELLLKMNGMKAELLRSEESRNNLDRTWAQEYGFLRSQLSVFESQGSLLSMMYEKNEDMLMEKEKLKKDLNVKDKQILEIKKNRDDTIQRYDSLVDQLQMDVDVIKQNKQYLTLQEPGKQLKKSFSETFKFKKGKSKTEDKCNLNPKANSKFWSLQTVSSSVSLESIPQASGRSCECPQIQSEKDYHEVEGESILNIISSKLLGYYNNIESQPGTTLIRITDNRNSLRGKYLAEEEQ